MLVWDGAFNGSHVLCAVSGGADSVALLCLLNEKRKEGLIRLSAAHFEHGIRGEDSVGDMEYVKQLCNTLSVPLYIGRGNVPLAACQAKEGLEACARRLRHGFLESTQKNIGADFIALAHHKRDRAETVLMHILRGGGINGAAAMPFKSGPIIRPLIDTSPEELREYLAKNGISWREDSTNFEADNPRNALRLNVLPEIKKIYPGAESALSRYSEIALAENACMERLTDGYLSQNLELYGGIYILNTDGDIALVRRAVKRILPESGFETVQNALCAHALTDLGGGFRGVNENGKLYLIPPLDTPKETALSLNGPTELKGVCSVLASPCAAEPVKNNGDTQVLALCALQGATLRLRREGDFIKPLGMGGKTKSLGDYLTDRRFPLALRDRLPLLVRGGEIMWVPFVGISENAKITPDSEAVRLKINIFGGKQQ